jgi:eukaryotic-like serine/threonine-protein kinase
MQASPISAESIREQLNKILSSSLFAGADRSRALLKFVVEQSVNQQTDRLKEYTLGAEALGRGDSFDPRTDPIVRAEASRLRSRLERYYAAEGRSDPVEITLPKGSYIPQFVGRDIEWNLDRRPDRRSDRNPDRRSPQANATLSPSEAVGPAASRTVRLRWITFAAAAIAIDIWAGMMLLNTRTGNVPHQVVQFDIAQPPGTIFAPPISRQPFAISPDGTRLAFTVTGPNGTNIWIRDLAALDMRPVPGTEGTWALFWSPDSRSIFFTVKESLKQVNLDTNSTHSAATLPYQAIYGTWRSKEDLLLYLGPHLFYELHVENGSLQKLPDQDMRWAQFLPGSDTFIHVTFDEALGRYRAIATDYITHKSTNLLETDSRVQYAPPRHGGEPGYLLFVRGGSLLAQPFDAAHLRLLGEPFPIVQNIVYFHNSASASFSVSTNGVLVYQAGFPLSELRWYDRAGHVLSDAFRPAPFTGNIRISPDGGRVAAGVWTPDAGGPDIWVFDRNGRESRRLTYPPSSHFRPVWSPDGKLIVFGSSRTAGPRLTTLKMVEGETEQPMKESAHVPHPADVQVPTDWSSDGRFIVFDTGLGEENRQVWLADAVDGRAIPFLHGDSAQWGAAFSPDCKQIAFISEQSGRPEVYVQDFQSTPTPQLVGERRRISRDGAWIVRWRADGRELFYAGVDSRIYAVQIAHGAVVGEPKALFQIPGNPQFGTPTDFQFDVAPDGKQFAMTTAASAAPPPFTVIQNWQDKFRR